jgi:hypothetical protein
MRKRGWRDEEHSSTQELESYNASSGLATGRTSPRSLIFMKWMKAASSEYFSPTYDPRLPIRQAAKRLDLQIRRG